MRLLDLVTIHAVRTHSRHRTVVLVAVIALLLPALALLQYQWLGELSTLEQVRAKDNLEAAAQRFSSQFDTMLAGVYATYHSSQTGSPIGGHEGRAIRPVTPAGLIKQVHIIERSPGGVFTSHALDADGREAGPGAWPAWLEGTAAGGFGQDDDLSALPAGLQRTILEEVPAIVVRLAPQPASRWAAIELDRQVILDELLPAMLAGCLEGGIPVNYDVLIHREDPFEDVVYQSGPGLTRSDFRSWVTYVPMFAIHNRDLNTAAAHGLRPDAPAHRWRLYIKPRTGELEAAVGAARRRNFGIGIGVLALLGLSIGLLVASMRRVEQATREQLELVARISHELRTPLSTITCAGENLADNVVDGPDGTQQYGQMIMREGRRLTRTLSDILLCCRLQARPDTVLDLQPTNVADVVDLALSDAQMMTGDEPAAIALAVEPALPPVLADREALRMAVKNLIVNAVRHGGGRSVRVSVGERYAGTAREVWIAVEDEGPGIPAEEMAKVFEPFYRGRAAKDMEVDGSGIGLSIVQQVVRSHGGSVRVSSREAAGTRFTLQLPAMRPAAAARLAEVAPS